MSTGLRWCNENLSNVTWLLKVDDDVMMNPFILRDFLIEEEKLNVTKVGYDPLNSIYGRLRTITRPWRQGKYKVTKVSQ